MLPYNWGILWLRAVSLLLLKLLKMSIIATIGCNRVAARDCVGYNQICRHLLVIMFTPRVLNVAALEFALESHGSTKRLLRIVLCVVETLSSFLTNAELLLVTACSGALCVNTNIIDWSYWAKFGHAHRSASSLFLEHWRLLVRWAIFKQVSLLMHCGISRHNLQLIHSFLELLEWGAFLTFNRFVGIKLFTVLTD